MLHKDGGIFASASKGTVICDASTISPVASKDFAAQAVEREMVFVDSPMSGGTNGAIAGTLTFMVGAEEEHFK